MAFDTWLRRQGLSRYEFAKRYKISQPFISQLINEVRKPSKDMIDYLVNITGLKKEDFRPDLYGSESLFLSSEDEI